MASTTATIANVAPTGVFVIPTGALEHAKAVLSFAGVTDPGTADVLQYAFDCGDGKGYGALSTSNNRPCVPPDNGTYAVKGRVQDGEGGMTDYAGYLTVANVAPTGALTLPTKAVSEGQAYSAQFTKVIHAPNDLPLAGYSIACPPGSGILSAFPPTALRATSEITVRTRYRASFEIKTAPPPPTRAQCRWSTSHQVS